MQLRILFLVPKVVLMTTMKCNKRGLFFTDGLCRDGQITTRQFDTWDNPTTVEKFKSWHKRNFGTEHK